MATETSKPVDKQLGRFQQIKVGGAEHLDRITDGDREAIPLLVQVGRLLDRIYIRQHWSGNEALHAHIHALEPRDPKLDLGLKLFKGPWGLDEEKYIKSIKERNEDGTVSQKIHVPREPPQHGNYYPDDISKEEYSEWLNGLEGQAKLDAQSYYHVVKRDPTTRQLHTTPYSEEYKDLLVPAAELLRQSARLVSDDTLAMFLKSRAEAFISNDYTASDIDWLRISKESPLEVTCGPYEVSDRQSGEEAMPEVGFKCTDPPICFVLRV